MKLNWGNWIVIAFVLFGINTFALVYISMRQDIPLVSENYYQEELVYGDKMNKINNAAKMKPTIKYIASTQVLHLLFAGGEPVSGKATFFRPDDARKDYDVDFTTEEGEAIFETGKMAKGLWKLKLNWLADGKEYFNESNLVIQ